MKKIVFATLTLFMVGCGTKEETPVLEEETVDTLEVAIDSLPSDSALDIIVDTLPTE